MNGNQVSAADVLQEAISKAVANGWHVPELPPRTPYTYVEGTRFDHLFDHDFAKALWGEKDFTWFDLRLVTPRRDDLYELHAPAWRYHLQQMVLAEDPIAYLAENM